MSLLKFSMMLVLAFCVQSAPATYPPDSSLSREDYVELGMPAPDRTWSPPEYRQAVDVLTQLGAEEPALFPRFRSELSGDIFSRLTASDNLLVLKSESLPIEVRIKIAADLQLAARDLLLVYLKPASKNIVFDDELVELMGFLLAVSVEAADCAEQFRRTLPSDDPQREVRRQAFRSDAERDERDDRGSSDVAR